MEATIGFDLRSTVSDASWTVDRRTRYLMRREVAAVRSDLSNLFAAAHALHRADAVAVRITALEEDGPAGESAGPIGRPAGRHDPLGYDVADYYLLGGLTNCGYEPEEAAALAQYERQSPHPALTERTGANPAAW
jgi:hypothetical protein